MRIIPIPPEPGGVEMAATVVFATEDSFMAQPDERGEFNRRDRPSPGSRVDLRTLFSTIIAGAAPSRIITLPAATLVSFAGFVDKDFLEQTIPNTAAANLLVILKAHVNDPALGGAKSGDDLSFAISLYLNGKLRGLLLELCKPLFPIIAYIYGDPQTIRGLADHNLA